MMKSSRKVVSYVCTQTVSAKTPQVESKLYGSIMQLVILTKTIAATNTINIEKVFNYYIA